MSADTTAAPDAAPAGNPAVGATDTPAASAATGPGRQGGVRAPEPLRPLPPGTIVPVAGVSHHAETVASTRIGDDVILTHDQSNPYDTDAVKITTMGGDLLGHVPTLARLNSRLLMHHRGGIWAGTIVDKVGVETIGLRVKIHSLVGHRPVGFGADAPGHRGPLDAPEVIVTHPGVHEPDSQRNEATAADQAAVQPGPAATLVYARGSNRVLGELVEQVGSRVRVQTGDRVTAYPAGVVRVGDTT